MRRARRIDYDNARHQAPHGRPTPGWTYHKKMLALLGRHRSLGYDGGVKELPMHVRFALGLLIAAEAVAQNKPGDWPMYNHDIGSTRYSALNQITTANVGKLTQAWTFTTRAANAPGRGGGPGIGMQAVP